VISDVQSLLDSAMNEEEIDYLWIREYGVSYDPPDDGLTYREWFEEILGILRAKRA
jgi:hypothetical protein